MFPRSIVPVLLPALCVVFSAGAVQAAPPARDAVVVYSNLCWLPESGDAAGYRIRLGKAGGRQTLSLEWSEGALKGPVQASSLTIDPGGTKVAFAVPIPVNPGERQPFLKLKGRFVNNTLLLEQIDWDDRSGPKPIREVLTRGRDTGENLPDCQL